jgi:hypothetical protein
LLLPKRSTSRDSLPYFFGGYVTKFAQRKHAPRAACSRVQDLGFLHLSLTLSVCLSVCLSVWLPVYVSLDRTLFRSRTGKDLGDAHEALEHAETI